MDGLKQVEQRGRWELTYLVKDNKVELRTDRYGPSGTSAILVTVAPMKTFKHYIERKKWLERMAKSYPNDSYQDQLESFMKVWKQNPTITTLGQNGNTEWAWDSFWELESLVREARQMIEENRMKGD